MIRGAPTTVAVWPAEANLQRERFVVLKEATGNMALAASVVCGYLLWDQPSGWWNGVVLGSILTLMFWYAHFDHARKQAHFEINVLERNGILNAAQANEMRSRV